MAYPEFGRGAVANPRLRPTKFTPERIQQIKELIARQRVVGRLLLSSGLPWAR
jgi:hypothetical protein